MAGQQRNFNSFVPYFDKDRAEDEENRIKQARNTKHKSKKSANKFNVPDGYAEMLVSDKRSRRREKHRRDEYYNDCYEG